MNLKDSYVVKNIEHIMALSKGLSTVHQSTHDLHDWQWPRRRLQLLSIILFILILKSWSDAVKCNQRILSVGVLSILR